MLGLSPREARFALLISSTHFSQHVYFRILPPLIPVLAVALTYPLWQLGLLMTMYSLGMGAAHAPLGVLADRVDRRYLLPTGIGLTGGAYVLFAVAPEIGAFLPGITLLGHSFEGGYLVMSVAMLVVGLGLAVVHPAGYPMITDNVEPGNKGAVLGLFGAASKLGDGATPALIAGLILVFTWEQIILLFGVAGIVYGVLLSLVLQNAAYETRPARTRNGDTDDTEGDVLPADRRAYLYPLGAIYLFFASSGLTARGIATFLPAFLIAVYAHSTELAGVHLGAESVANLYFALLLFAGAIMQLYLGRLTDVYDPRHVLLGCMGLATAGMVALALVDLGPVLLAVVIFVLGSGLFGVNPPRDALISDISPPEYEGRTFGYMFTAVILTGAIYPTVVGYLLEAVGMREGFLILTAGTVLGALAIVLLYSTRVYIRTKDVHGHSLD